MNATVVLSRPRINPRTAVTDVFCQLSSEGRLAGAPSAIVSVAGKEVVLTAVVVVVVVAVVVEVAVTTIFLAFCVLWIWA